MKRSHIVLLFLLIANLQCFALDHIILRNGQAFDVKLHQITDDAVLYRLNGDNDAAMESTPSKDVYMVYIEKQGNVYLTPDGKRITGESDRVDRKKFDAIYLVSGQEVGAKNIKVTEDAVIYTPVKKGGLLSNIIGSSNSGGRRAFSLPEVFMIRYKSGMTDVITPLEIAEEPQEEIKEIKETKKEDSRHIIFYHTVTKGESLKKIAGLYNATISQIIDWNGLPKNSQPNTPLTQGTQLTIYLPR